MTAEYTTKTAHRDGYDFARDGQVTWVGDAHHKGTSVFWSDHRDRWIFVDHENPDVTEVEHFAAVRLLAEGDADDGLNQAMLACDLDGPGLWLIPVDALDDFDVDYVEVVFRTDADQ